MRRWRYPPRRPSIARRRPRPPTLPTFLPPPELPTVLETPSIIPGAKSVTSKIIVLVIAIIIIAFVVFGVIGLGIGLGIKKRSSDITMPTTTVSTSSTSTSSTTTLSCEYGADEQGCLSSNAATSSSSSAKLPVSVDSLSMLRLSSTRTSSSSTSLRTRTTIPSMNLNAITITTSSTTTTLTLSSTTSTESSSASTTPTPTPTPTPIPTTTATAAAAATAVATAAAAAETAAVATTAATTATTAATTTTTTATTTTSATTSNMPVPYAWSSVVALYVQSNRICSGFLLTNRHVVTAATCVYNLDETAIVVYFGIVTLSSRNSGHARSVASVSYPSTFRKGRVADDVAVLTLSTNVTLSATVGVCPIPYTTTVPQVGEFGIVVGWNDMLSSSDSLQQADVQVESPTTCGLSAFTRSQLCARYGRNSRCLSDRGSPLIVNSNDEKWICAGLIPGGRSECKSVDTYTRVSFHSQFILSAIR